MPGVVIPGGVWRDDSGHLLEPLREVVLRPVGGEDELFLLDSAERALPSERASTLLARCLDDADAVNTVRGLTVGDREALLLHLRRLTLGETFDCVMRCPEGHCQQQMELELRVSDLLLPGYADPRRQYELVLDADGAEYTVSFRLPTAADLDRAAALARREPEQAARSMLENCVIQATRDEICVPVAALTPAVRTAISGAMADHDPQAEIELDLTCPSCSATFSILFDTATFFLQELDERAARLTQEVHTLASHYHWSERDILGLPRSRRARYLDLVAYSAASARAP